MKFRYARHSNNIQKLCNFYTTILGFQKLGEFNNHDGYNGVFLGKDGQNWHLEFTENAEVVNHNFNPDDALVFYPNSFIEFKEILKNVEDHQIQYIQPKNPYWHQNAICIQDPDGMNIMIYIPIV